jgi:hypothetical protein
MRAGSSCNTAGVEDCRGGSHCLILGARGARVVIGRCELRSNYHSKNGLGDIYSPKNVSLQEDQRYQNVRIIAVSDTNQTHCASGFVPCPL